MAQRNKLATVNTIGYRLDSHLRKLNILYFLFFRCAAFRHPTYNSEIQRQVTQWIQSYLKLDSQVPCTYTAMYEIQRERKRKLSVNTTCETKTWFRENVVCLHFFTNILCSYYNNELTYYLNIPRNCLIKSKLLS